jgi:hypothetical protein
MAIPVEKPDFESSLDRRVAYLESWKEYATKQLDAIYGFRGEPSMKKCPEHLDACPCVGDVFECAKCGMKLECTDDCGCDDCNCVSLICCGQLMGCQPCDKSK